MIRQKVSLITSVWGDWHTGAFLHLNLPSLLAPLNLPAFTAMHDVSFVIFTTDRDRTRIAAAPVFRRLSEITKVAFEPIAADEIRDPVGTQQRVWWRAIDHVNRLRTHLFFLPPDVVWSNASMHHIGVAMARGCHIVIIPWTVRVVAETFQPAITAYFSECGYAGISSRELVRMTFEHLHPLIAAYRRDSAMFPRHPEMLIETVPKQGLLLRLLASIPTVYKPSDVPLNENKLTVGRFPDEEIYVPGDSDEVFVASLAPLDKDFTFFDKPRRADPVSIGLWWLGYRSESNDLLVRTSYRIHAGVLEPAAWRAAERAFDYFLRRCVIGREALEVWQAMRKRSDCSIAVEAIAGALHTGSLARAVRGRGERLVFLPDNTAFAAMSRTDLNTLMSLRGRPTLIRLFRRHMALLNAEARTILAGHAGTALLQTDDEGRVELRRDAQNTLFVDGIAIVDGPATAGDHVVIITSALRRSSGVGSTPEDFSLFREPAASVGTG
jgi:hypothetical protein